MNPFGIDSARAQSMTAQGTMGGGFDVVRSGGTFTENALMGGPKSAAPRCGAQPNGSYVMCEPVPGISPVQTDPAGFFRELYILAFVAAGTVAFVRIVYGGIIYGTSGVVDKKNDARKIFTGVAQGIALLMGSYVILNAINPALVRLKFPEAADYIPAPVPTAYKYGLKGKEDADLIQINKEMDRMSQEFEDAGIRLTRETGSQFQDLAYQENSLARHQSAIAALEAMPNRTEDQEDRLKFLNGLTEGYQRDLSLAQKEMELLKQTDPAAAAGQTGAKKNQIIGFMQINIDETKRAIAELRANKNRTEAEDAELKFSEERLPVYLEEIEEMRARPAEAAR